MSEAAFVERRLRERPDLVESVARAVTGADSARLGPWSVEDLAPGRAGNPTSGAVIRVAGAAHVDGQEVRWSAVLKVVRSPEGPEAYDSPQNPIYWRRELEVARSGLLSGLVGLRAPRCYRIDEPDARTGWLWSEDLGELDREPWSEVDYRRAARALARFHAVTLGRPRSAGPDWLDRPDFVADLAQLCRPMFGALIAGVDAGRGAYEPLLVPELAPVLDLVRDPGPVLRLASRVPPAICHNDFNLDNLLLRRTSQGQDEVVAFDWQMVGVASVSSDLSQLLCYLPAMLHGRPREQVERSVVADYVSVLEQHGFVLEPEAVMAATVADGAARQAMFGLYMLCSELEGRESAGDVDGARSLVERFVAAWVAGPVPDLVRRAQAHVRDDSTTGRFSDGRPAAPGSTPGGTS